MYWYGFMEKQIVFLLPDSSLHTKQHCARVLLFALIIGIKSGLSSDELDALAQVAVFHDSRRQDDCLDIGHGQRGADYYLDYCEQNHFPYDPRVYYAIYYHDRPDVTGQQAILAAPGVNPSWIQIYYCFKDADGLDRFRLGPNGLNVNMLRTETAKNLVAFAKKLVRDTQ